MLKTKEPVERSEIMTAVLQQLIHPSCPDAVGFWNTRLRLKTDSVWPNYYDSLLLPLAKVPRVQKKKREKKGSSLLRILSYYRFSFRVGSRPECIVLRASPADKILPLQFLFSKSGRNKCHRLTGSSRMSHCLRHTLFLYSPTFL